MKDKIIVYHGSVNIIDKPTYGVGKAYNDYGLGFYTTENIELAKEWAVDETHSGYANKYELDLSNLNILDLSKLDTLNWISILLKNRFFELKNDIAIMGKEYLLKNYLIDYEKYDVIIGYRADDSYFAFAEDFLNNTISINVLGEALKLGNLGIQIVLKSKKAFDNIKYIGNEKVDNKKYYPLREKRNIKAKNDFLTRKRETRVTDLFLIDLIRGGVK